jgi:type II restriction enzyme
LSKWQVLENWNKTSFLQETWNLETKGWLLDVMRCIDMLWKDTFSLKDMYEFKSHLSQLHPENNHIPDKIRQQLQKLIVHWYIERLENGIYKKL